MTAPKPIATDEWLAALEELNRSQIDRQSERDGYLSALEIRQRTGWSPRKLFKILHEANKKGLLQVTKYLMPDISGRLNTVPCYRIKLTP